MCKKSRILSIVFALTGIMLLATGCGKKTPSSRLHCTASADCEAFAYCDSTEIMALLRDVYEVIPDKYTQEIAKELTKEVKGIDKVNLDDVVEGYRAIDPKVFVSVDSMNSILSGRDFDGVRLAIQLQKDLPVYKLYKAFAPVAQSNMPTKVGMSMPSTGENILLIGSDVIRTKMEGALEQKGKDTLPDDMLEGIPEESICYVALRLKTLLSMIGSDEDMDVLGNDLNSVVRDARTLNLSVVRNGKRQVTCYVNVFYEDKAVAKKHLEVVKKTLKDISKEMNKEEKKKFLEIFDKLSVSREGKALRLKCILNILTQKSIEEIFGKAEEKERSIKCTSNMKMLELGMRLYTDDYDGAFSPQKDWEKKVNDYVGDMKAFQCPTSGKKYRYIYGAKKESEIREPSKSFDLICEQEHEKGKLHVGFVDGHVESVDKSKVEKAIKNCAKGKLPCLD